MILDASTFIIASSWRDDASPQRTRPAYNAGRAQGLVVTKRTAMDRPDVTASDSAVFEDARFEKIQDQNSSHDERLAAAHGAMKKGKPRNVALSPVIPRFLLPEHKALVNKTIEGHGDETRD